MDARRSLSALKVVVPVLSLLACTPVAGSWQWGRATARLEVGGGTVEVALRPDRGALLPLTPDGPHRFLYTGPTADLVGGSYSILLRNRTGERLKVVVAVDGLNVYGREVVAGSSAEDVGSILSPWSERMLPGWQLDGERAQRFVFSPQEWSEGEGRTEAQIGTVTVQVYREWQEPTWERQYSDDALGSPKESAGAAAPRGQSESTAEPPIALQRRAPIGTASGDDVESSVRTVRFVAATAFPESWAVIDYGGSQYGWQPPRPRYEHELLGLYLAPAAHGTLVVDVAPGSAGDRAGIEAGDVIVRIDTVSGPTSTETRRILRAKDRGEFAFVRVRRGPHELAVKIRS